MLKLTKRADYGMMAMRYLAEHADDGRPHSARDISDAYNIPLPVLAKTLQTLTRARLIASQHGATGGYALARPAQAISTLDVISAFDGSPVITNCTTVDGKSCEIVGHCMVKEPLRQVNDRIREMLGGITIAELIDLANGSRPSAEEKLVSILF